MGTRLQDVHRADDLAAVTSALGGRWCLITLTVDRRLFTDPEAAYQRCNEYVRKAITGGCPRGVFVSCFEVQGKTGDGWPHWHVLAWVPDGRSADEIKAAVLAGWRTRAEHVSQDTGEVTYSRERIGFVDVEVAESAVACGKYVGKYLMKSWPAVPSWMLESRRRFRKLRPSSGLYLVLERLHRHERVSGRRPERKGTGRRTRRLIDRLVRSGSALSVFRRVNGALKHAGIVPVHIEDVETFAGEQARAVRLGEWRRVRVSMSWAEYQRRRARIGDLVRERWRRMERARVMIESAWSYCQVRRREGGEDDVPGVG